MSRTALYKCGYFGIIGCGAVILAWVMIRFQLSPAVILAILLAALVPGALLAFYWRDLLKGLRLLKTREFAASKQHSERFLADVQQRPWLKKLVWLGTSTYSRDPEVLALNNLGAAEIGLGEVEAARRHLHEAIALDGQCPLPFFNLGKMALAAHDEEEAVRCLMEAYRLGYRFGLSDKIIRNAQVRFAGTAWPHK